MLILYVIDFKGIIVRNKYGYFLMIKRIIFREYNFKFV